jgi:hypothetical protein
MSVKRKIEVFSAGCTLCEETIAMVRRLAYPSCDVAVLDLHDPAVAARAKNYGVGTVPAVVVDGRFAGCCTGGGPDEAGLTAAGVGLPLP